MNQAAMYSDRNEDNTMKTAKITIPSLGKTLLGSLCLASLLGLGACNGGAGESATPADFDSEVYGNQSWTKLSPQKQAADMPTGKIENATEVVDTHQYACTSTEYSMTKTPKEFISIDPDASIVWLGNLIQGDSHLQVGELQELPISERAPLSISIDLLRADNFRIVAHPSLITVNAAIGGLIEDAVNAGHEASTDVYFESKEAHSTEQTSLDLGFTAEYLGGRAETSLSVDNQGEEHTFFAYFIQRAFTVSMVLPTAPHDMVTDAFSQEQLDTLKGRDKIGDSNPPLYVSSMTYGRVLIYKMTSSDSKQRIKAAINASYNGLAGGGSGYTEAELQKTLSTAKIEISAFGGNQANIEALIRTGELRSYFTGDTKLTSMRPISFELRNLQDNTTAHITRTTEYNVKQCTYLGETTPPIGEKVKVIFDKVYIPSDCDGGIDKGDIYGRFDVIAGDINGNDVTTRVKTISRNNVVKVQSGNTLQLGAAGSSVIFNRYHGKTFRISGQLMDADGGTRGSDDIVGNWNANQFDIATAAPGTRTKRAVSNCNGNNPTLTYRIEKVADIYR